MLYNPTGCEVSRLGLDGTPRHPASPKPSPRNGRIWEPRRTPQHSYHVLSATPSRLTEPPHRPIRHSTRRSALPNSRGRRERPFTPHPHGINPNPRHSLHPTTAAPGRTCMLPPSLHEPHASGTEEKEELKLMMTLAATCRPARSQQVFLTSTRKMGGRIMGIVLDVSV